MKQVAFVVEVVDTKEQPTIVIRIAGNGQVVKICHEPNEVSSFLEEVVERFKVVPSNNCKSDD